LHIGRIDTHPLKINLILDITHHDKSSHNAFALGTRHARTNLAIPHIMRALQQRSHRPLRHRQQNRIVVLYGFSLGDPVRLGRVPEILVDGLDVAEVLELVVSGFTDGVGDAGV